MVVQVSPWFAERLKELDTHIKRKHLLIKKEMKQNENDFKQK